MTIYLLFYLFMCLFILQILIICLFFHYHLKQKIHLLQIRSICFEVENQTLLETVCGGKAVIVVDVLKFTALIILDAGA